MDATKNASGSIPAPLPHIAAEGAHWYKFLSRWSLIAGLVNVGLFLAFFTVLMPASESGPLAPEHFELSAAISTPALYRLSITLDIAAWLVLGGFLITLATILVCHAPIRSTFVAACGIGTVAGLIGAFLRLEGVSELAGRYATAALEEQEALLEPFLELERVVFTHFDAGALLWSIALVLAASAAWQVAAFPRWLTVLIALPGIIGLTHFLFSTLTGGELPSIISLLQLLLLPVIYFAVAKVFWRHRLTDAAGVV